MREGKAGGPPRHDPEVGQEEAKQPSFAAGVDREQVRRGAEELGVDFDTHVAKVIAAMEERAQELGLERGLE